MDAAQNSRMPEFVMDRRSLIATGLATLAAAPVLAQNYPASGTAAAPPAAPAAGPPPMPPVGAATFSDSEIVNHVSDFFGVGAETAAAVVEKVFAEKGRPTGYIAGAEGSGAFVFGLRYGRGLLYMKERPTQQVYWQGPSVGFDTGGNVSRAFVLCYNLQYPDAIYRRFPGVDGSAYFIGGLGVNYQQADEMVLAPIRTGMGLRLGANIGYLAYSRHRNIIPL
jgi:hypothetical protein